VQSAGRARGRIFLQQASAPFASPHLAQVLTFAVSLFFAAVPQH
jgi:hypothetical protein